VTLGVDADPTGNSATVLGSREPCISVSSGTTFDVDITVTGVTDLLAWDIYFTFDPSVVNIADRNVSMLLAHNDGSSVFNLSESVPDSSGHYRTGAFDTECSPDNKGPCESGSGVLARLTLKAVGPGVSPAALPLYLGVGLGPSLVDVDGHYLGDANGDNFYDGPVSAAWIAVDQACPSEPPPSPTPWPTPSPTATGSPTATPTSAPTVTPGPTSTPGVTATPTPAGPGTAWAYSCYLGASHPAEEALAAVSGDVLAAYRLKPGQGYDRWFPGRSDVSTITVLNPFDALLLLVAGDADWPQEPSGESPTGVDLVFGWNSVCYTGEAKDVAAATQEIAGQFALIYTLAADQGWQRFIPGRPELTSLSRLEPATPVLILVTAGSGTRWEFGP
jgi:hypothetical protein